LIMDLKKSLNQLLFLLLTSNMQWVPFFYQHRQTIDHMQDSITHGEVFNSKIVITTQVPKELLNGPMFGGGGPIFQLGKFLEISFRLFVLGIFWRYKNA
jgi:hypothetical protein